MNQKALNDYGMLEWDSARKTLLDALLIAKKAQLGNDPLVARTYVNLGAVYLTGFKRRDKAIYCFSRALEIDPVIQLSPRMATQKLNETFEDAKSTRGPGRTSAPNAASEEKDLPVKIHALDCPNEDETMFDRPVTLRCALAPNLGQVATVFLMYRELGKQTYTELRMTRSPKGWYVGKIPKRAMTGSNVPYYFEGRDASGKPVVRNGEESSPNLL